MQANGEGLPMTSVAASATHPAPMRDEGASAVDPAPAQAHQGAPAVSPYIEPECPADKKVTADLAKILESPDLTETQKHFEIFKAPCDVELIASTLCVSYRWKRLKDDVYLRPGVPKKLKTLKERYAQNQDYFLALKDVDEFVKCLIATPGITADEVLEQLKRKRV